MCSKKVVSDLQMFDYPRQTDSWIRMVDFDNFFLLLFLSGRAAMLNRLIRDIPRVFLLGLKQNR